MEIQLKSNLINNGLNINILCVVSIEKKPYAKTSHTAFSICCNYF
jgi:hypothetical protein